MVDGGRLERLEVSPSHSGMKPASTAPPWNVTSRYASDIGMSAQTAFTARGFPLATRAASASAMSSDVMPMYEPPVVATDPLDQSCAWIQSSTSE